MSLLFAILALNLAFAVYLFFSLRNSPASYWDKAEFRSRSKARVNRSDLFYDAFSGRQPQWARNRTNTGQY